MGISAEQLDTLKLRLENTKAQQQAESPKEGLQNLPS
ncbi:hypothetical protein AcdelDRAFT_1495 [Acidovorax delafieldii 2AN]|jgi:hypothetical protein|uniref:Uncharacterized protein n=1 Tax=Acidovorax delafieldii 2AN TaxID=573060 RepID=C5T3M7_ACIDE|nr:hypothetical protein AcdelDRAFT_1495 [Acidovorax delafieldii 2AN]